MLSEKNIRTFMTVTARTVILISVTAGLLLTPQGVKAGEVPEIYTTPGSTVFTEDEDGVPVDGALSLVDGINLIPGAKVMITNNFVTGEDYLDYTPVNGIGGTYNATTGVLTMSKAGGASAADWQAALSTVQYRNSSQDPNTAERTITFIIGANNDYFPDTNHYYRFIPYNDPVSGPGHYMADCYNMPSTERTNINNPEYEDRDVHNNVTYCTSLGARDEADNDENMLYGMRGYLATITSEAEKNFIKTKVGTVMGWIGASDASTEGNWRWVTGPEGLANGGTGTPFWLGNGTTGHVVLPADGGTGYHNWATGEPNNVGTNPPGEDFGHIKGNDPTNNTWNDIPNQGGDAAHDKPAGFMVEYGDTPGDTPPTHLTAIKTVSVVAVNDPPSDVVFFHQYTLPSTTPPGGTPVGTLEGQDADSFEFTYELVPGDGDTDNGLFYIDGPDLLTAEGQTYVDDGNYSIRISVSDGEYSPEIIRPFTINIVVGDPPTISAIDDRTIDEDTNTGAIVFTISDPDGTASIVPFGRSMNLSLVPNANITFGGSGSSRTVTITPVANKFGSAWIGIYVWDSLNEHVARETLILTVNPVDDPPTISNISDKATNEDTSTAEIPIIVNDIDSDVNGMTLSYEALTNPDLISAGGIEFGGTGSNRWMKITPSPDQNGQATIRVTVNDGDGETAYDDFVFTVAAVNDPPTISTIDDRTINKNSNTGAISFTIGDLETAPASLTLGKNSSNTTLVPLTGIVFGGSGANRTVTVTPATGQSGTSDITVSVSDGSLSASTIFTLTVNDPPALPTNTALNVNEGQSGTITSANLSATDTDNTVDQLTYTLVTLPARGTLKKNGTALGVSGTFTQLDINNNLITYQHDGSETTTDSFTFNLQDPAGSGPTNVTFNITITSSNDAPVVATNTGLFVNEGQSVVVTNAQLNATDPDNSAEQLTYTLTAIPAYGTLKKSSGALSIGGTFTQADINNSLIEYQHTVMGYFADSFKFNLDDPSSAGPDNVTVNIEINIAPVMTANTGASVAEGGRVTIASAYLNATDVNNTPDQLTYTIVNVPLRGTLYKGVTALTVGGTFTQANINSGQIAYQHDGSEQSTDSFRFNLHDPAGGGPNDVDFSFTIIPVNDAPSIAANNSVAVNRGQKVKITIAQLNAADVDNAPDELIYTLQTLPTNGTLYNGLDAVTLYESFTQADINNNLIEYAHNGTLTTADNFKFDLKDLGGLGPEDITYNLTVNQTNAPPADIFLTPGAIDEGQAAGSVVGTLTTDDPDSTVFTYTLVDGVGSTDNDSFTISGDQLLSAHIFDYEVKDEYAIRVRTNDGTDTLEKALIVSINDINDLPIASRNTGLSVERAASGTIRTRNLEAVDQDDLSNSLVFTVKSLPVLGDLKLNETPMSIDGTFTNADIANQLLKYYHTDGDESKVTDHFTFTISDDGGGVSQLYTFNFTIGTNQQPSMDINTGLLMNERGGNFPITNTMLQSYDEDDPIETLTFTLITIPENGYVEKNGVELAIGGTFTQADINAGLIAYQHDEESYNPNDSFVFALQDARGGIIEEDQTFVIRGVVVTVVNDDIAYPGSLRAILTNAQAGDTLVFDDEVAASEIVLASGPITVNKDVTISGPASINGDNLDRIFEIPSGQNVTLEGLTLYNGRADQGGAIYNGGTLVLSTSIVRGNLATSSGGAIYNNGTLTLSGVSITGNTSNGVGGGIHSVASASLTIAKSLLNENVATTSGGGVLSEGNLAVVNSTFYANTANDDGGGLMAQSGSVTIDHSTVVANIADSDYAAGGSGGGIYAAAGSTMRVMNSLLSEGKAGSADADCVGAVVTSMGYNFVRYPAGCTFAAAGDIIGKDPKIGALFGNPGEVPSIPILGKSPAMDTGLCTMINGDTNLEDQRGIPRPIGGDCDIGAYEMDSLAEIFYDDTDPEVVLGPDWVTNPAVMGAYNSTVSTTSKRYAALTFTFRGDRVSLLYWLNRTRAQAEVTITDVTGTPRSLPIAGAIGEDATPRIDRLVNGAIRVVLSQKGSASQRRWSVWGLGKGVHQITIRNISGKRGTISLDAFGVLRPPVSAKAGETVEDDDTSKIAYYGFWQPQVGYIGASNDTLTTSYSKGDQASLSFTGDRIAVHFIKSSGIMQLNISGVAGFPDSIRTMNLQERGGPAGPQQFYISGLGNGAHVLNMVNGKKAKVNLDAVTVLGPPSTLIQPGTYIEDDQLEDITYDGFWQKPVGMVGASGGTVTSSTRSGDLARLQFIGDRLTIRYAQSSDKGTMDVTITNVGGEDLKFRLNQKGSPMPMQWSVIGLGNGVHGLVLRNTKKRPITIDSIIPSEGTLTAGIGTVQDDQTLNIAYQGYWQAAVDQTGNSITTSSQRGDKAKVTFLGDTIVLYYWQAYSNGIMKVDLEGVSHPDAKNDALHFKVDQSGPPGMQRWRIGGLGNGLHTITMTNAARGAINIDVIGIEGPTATASLGTIEDNNLHVINYQGHWQEPTDNVEASGGTYTISTFKSDKAFVKFIGDRLTYTYWQGPQFGSVDVKIDNIPVKKGYLIAKISQNGALVQRQWSVAGLGAGEHRFILTNTKDSKSNVDSIMISNPSVYSAGLGTTEDSQTEFISYQGGWQKPLHQSGASGLDETITQSILKKDVATFRFTGNRLTVIYWTAPNYKTLSVRVDGIANSPKGKKAELNQNGPIAQARWSVADLGSGEHIATFTNMKGGLVNIDALEVSNSGEIAGISTVEDDDYPRIAYSGVWKTNTNAAGASGNTLTTTDLKGDRATLNFTGDRMIIRYKTDPVAGKMSVKLDNVFSKKKSVTIDQKNSSGEYMQWQASGLGAGVHSLSMSNQKGRKTISIDSIQILPPPEDASSNIVQNDNMDEVVYSGFWQEPVDKTGASGGSITESRARGDNATVTFTGDQITLHYWQDMQYGRLYVDIKNIDGKSIRKVQINQRGGSMAQQYHIAGLGGGRKTMVITNVRKGTVNFDALEIKPTQQMAGVGPVIEDDATDKIGYTGLWKWTVAIPGSSGGSVVTSNTKNDRADMLFTGGQVILNYWQQPGSGTMLVEVRGSDNRTRRVRINQNGVFMQNRWIISDLPATGVHSLRITNFKGGAINLDSIELLDAPQPASAGIVEESEMGTIGYYGSWQPANQVGAVNGLVMKSNTPDDRAIINFTGSSFKVNYWDLGNGNLEITVKNSLGKTVRKEAIKQTGSMNKQVVTFDNLGPGLYTVFLKHVKAGTVNIDSLEFY